MDDPITHLTASAERMASAAEALSQALARFDAQQQALNVKVERIVAELDDRADTELQQLRSHVADLERANAELQAQAARGSDAAGGGRATTRKTLPPLVSSLLAKNGLEDPSGAIDAAVLDRTLASLSLEQRIAVKAEMARAGLIG